MAERASIDPARIREGDQVLTADSVDLGHVIAFLPDMIDPRFLVVEGGLIIHHDWYVPVDAIASYVPPGDGDPGRVTLLVIRAEVDAAGWNEPPPGTPSLDDLTGA